MEAPYKPSLKEKVKAIFKGAFVGAVSTLITVIVFSLLGILLFDNSELKNFSLSISSIIIGITIADTAWLAGLLVFALPLWLLLEKLNCTKKAHAIGLGCVMLFCVFSPIYLVVALEGFESEIAIGLIIVFLHSLTGGFVGWYIWNQTYGKALKRAADLGAIE